MSVLIISLPGDAHALATEWALGAKGVPAHFVSWSDYPQQLRMSFEFATGAERRLTLRNDDRALPETFRSVWNHRTCTPEPPAVIDRADHEAIQISADRVLRGMAAHYEQRAFAANPTRSKWYFDNKPTQLDAAVEVGFDIPDTLISNNPDDIRRFIATQGPCIVKPLKYLHWVSETTDIETFTTPIDSLEGFDDDVIAACPMIYQRQIDKVSEYRVVVFGQEITCFEILSQSSPESADDWRMCGYKDLSMRHVRLPERIDRLIRAFMAHCGFVYGSLDFAITADDRIVFFEINETGQFLWVEELVPEVPLLDMFSDFLIEARADFTYSSKADPIRFAPWMKDGVRHIVEDRSRHVKTRLDKRFPDRLVSAA